MFLHLLRPVARVTAVRVDPKNSPILWIHLIDYILQGNHAVFEHPIPGVFFSMAAVVQVHVLPITCIDPGSLGSFFDLRQDRLPLDYRVGVGKEGTLETVGEVLTVIHLIFIPTGPLVQYLLHDVHVD